MGLTNLLKNWLFPKKDRLSKKRKAQLISSWEKIEEKVRQGGESNYKMSLIEADKLFGRVLKELGYQEETWAKSMAKASDRFSNSTRNGVWSAHKLRNRLVHDESDELHSYQAKANLAKYRRGLKELNIL
jgi:conjugal transfer/entry exclusion protein